MVTKKVAKKSSTKKTTKKKTTKSTTKKQPTNTALLKKVAGVSDSTKTLSMEIKAMSKIFGENQKVLISIKDMIDTVSSAIEQIQKQSRQINIIEEDTQKLFSGLNQVRGQEKLVTKINDQTARLQDQIEKISEAQKTQTHSEKIMQKVSESIDSIRNNSKMIMNISERIDNVRDDLTKVSSKAGNTPVGIELGEIRKKIESISGRAEQIESLRGVMDNLKQEFQTMVSNTSSISGIPEQIDEIKRNIQSISGRTGNLGGDMENLKNELSSIASKTEEKITGISSLLSRTDETSSEFHTKTNQIIQELQGIKNASSRSSENTSKEVLALLKLSEYQSNIRMQTESKYGTLDDLEKMATQTSEMVNLFDKLSIESNQKIALPHEVRRWAVSKIMDCADRWEIRFSDVYKLLANQLGTSLLKEALRLQQVRDIYGIRAVDEIKQELNIS
jgi:DNA repair exonuclease SbcCD ATPase subunit